MQKEEEDVQLAHVEGLLAAYDPDFAPVGGDAAQSGISNAVLDEQSMHELHLVCPKPTLTKGG